MECEREYITDIKTCNGGQLFYVKVTVNTCSGADWEVTGTLHFSNRDLDLSHTLED